MNRKLKALFNRVFRRKEIALEFQRFHYENNKLEFSAAHPQIGIIAGELGKFFIEVGASNFLELTMFDPATIGTFKMTMQREGRLGDREVREKMRSALEQIHSHPEHDSYLIADKVLRELGYLKEQA